MTLAEAQADLRRSFVGGGPGVIVSGLVWAAAAATTAQAGIQTGFAALFFGGMLIAPLSILVVRVLFRRPGPQAGNGVLGLATESVAPLVAGLVVASLFLTREPDLAFPVAALTVGARYAVFRTMYGDATFLALGGVLSALAVIDAVSIVALPGGLLVWVAGVEIIVGLAMTVRALSKRADAAPTPS